MFDKENKIEYIRGCLIGGAIGDALGYAVEFLQYEEILRRYGKRGITEYDIVGDEQAIISDDTQMTLFTASGILTSETKGFDPSSKDFLHCLHTAYLDWLTTQGERKVPDAKTSWLVDIPQLNFQRAPGMTCLSALHSGKLGVIDRGLNSSKGCGSVMRIAPFGIFYGEKEKENMQDFWNQSAGVGALTHGHHLSHLSCAFMSSIIARILYPDPKEESFTLFDLLDQLIEDFEKNLDSFYYKEEFLQLMKKAIRLSKNEKSDFENITDLGEGWVAEEALAVAVYCACKYQHDPIGGIIAAVNHNGDSDSTGAIAGNILGALKGISAFNGLWIDNLELVDVITEIADDLAKGVPTEDIENNTTAGKAWLKKYGY